MKDDDKIQKVSPERPWPPPPRPADILAAGEFRPGTEVPLGDIPGFVSCVWTPDGQKIEIAKASREQLVDALNYVARSRDDIISDHLAGRQDLNAALLQIQRLQRHPCLRVKRWVEGWMLKLSARRAWRVYRRRIIEEARREEREGRR